MLELIPPQQEVLSTKDRITIDLIKRGKEFLEKYDINHGFILDCASIVYKFLKITFL